MRAWRNRKTHTIWDRALAGIAGSSPAARTTNSKIAPCTSRQQLQNVEPLSFYLTQDIALCIKTVMLKKRHNLSKSTTVAAIPAACSDELAAVEFFESMRWGSTPCCVKCGSVNVYQMESFKAVDGELQRVRNTRYLWRCRDCKEQFTVRIGTDTAALPRIPSFRIDDAKKDYAGKTVFSLSFSAQNADEVSIDPPVFPTLHGAPSGQFSVKPDKTTTYTLRAMGHGD